MIRTSDPASAETPTVSPFLKALIRTHHLPSLQTILLNTCLYLPSASVWVNTTHSCLPVYRRDLLWLPLDSYFFCSHASHLPSRWRAERDEKQTPGSRGGGWGGGTRCKGKKRVGFFWKTKVTFIQVVPDTLSQQRSQIERHQDWG